MNPLARAAPTTVPVDRAHAGWVAGAIRGDPAALDQLVRQQWPLVERLLSRMLGPRPDLEDLVQNVFLETLRALPRFEGRSKLSTFVGGITVRVAMRAMRRPKSAPRLDSLPNDVGTDEADPEQRTQTSRQLRQVHAILSSMTETKRAAFTLWALDGMAIASIADLMGASIPATRSRIFYAQKELREKASRNPELRELLGGPS